MVGIDALRGVVVVDLVGGDRRVGVEGDQGDVADLRAGGQARLGIDDEADVSHAAPGAVLGGQEAGEDVGGKLVFGSIDWNTAVSRPVAGFRLIVDLDVEVSSL